MDFPKETKELAEREASAIRSTFGNGQVHRALGLYCHLNNNGFSYGVREGIEQGKVIRWPHEIEEEWECIEAATYTYAVAEALGLRPRMITLRNWSDTTTGHETVDTNINGIGRVLVDPLNGMVGPVTYHPDRIEVMDNALTERCVLKCLSPKEVPRERAIARIEFYRSDEGVLALLCAGQGYSADGHHVRVRYDPKTQALEQIILTQPPFLEPTYYAERLFISRRNGLQGMSVEWGVFGDDRWGSLEGREPFYQKTA